MLSLARKLSTLNSITRSYSNAEQCHNPSKLLHQTTLLYSLTNDYTKITLTNLTRYPSCKQDGTANSHINKILTFFSTKNDAEGVIEKMFWFKRKTFFLCRAQIQMSWWWPHPIILSSYSIIFQCEFYLTNAAVKELSTIV